MRRPITNRRQSENISFVHEGISYTGSVSVWDDDLTTAEIFLDGGKPGSAVNAVARDSAVAASLALQYGVPLSVLKAALTRDDNGQAAGPLGALVDLISQD